MGLPVLEKKFYTVEEYFKISEESETRLEYEQGQIVDMGKTTDTHEELAFNLKASLKSSVKGRGCKVHMESVALEIDSRGKYYLPDVMLTCDESDISDRDIKRAPSLVAEVMSPGSVHRDKDVKFQSYLRIPSIQYYLLISQDKVRVEVYSKMLESKGWAFNYYESMEDLIQLDQLDIELKVGDIYEEVTLVSGE